MWIIDSSVGTKWIFQEDLTEKAEEVLQAIRRRKSKFIVPEIFFLEIANACWKRFQRGVITYHEAVRAFDQILGVPLRIYPGHELADMALETAMRLRVPVYDAIYLTLAEIHVSPVITADNKLVEACRGRFDFIEPLEEFSL